MPYLTGSLKTYHGVGTFIILILEMEKLLLRDIDNLVKFQNFRVRTGIRFFLTPEMEHLIAMYHYLISEAERDKKS